MDTTISIKPIQKVSAEVKKTEDWKHKNIDYVIASTKSLDSQRRATMQSKKRNYDLFNNRIDNTIFSHITNPFGLSTGKLSDFQLPSTLQCYDILYPIFSRLLSEENKRFFDPKVKIVNEGAISQKEDKRKELVMNIYQEYLMGYYDNMTPQQFTKYAQSYTIKDMREVQSTYLLSYYKRRLKLNDLFTDGFKDWLLAGEEIYRVSVKGGRLSVDLVNPLQVYFKIPENSEFIDNADQILEINYMTPSEVVDEFYEKLTPDQIDELENYHNSVSESFIHGPIRISEVESIYHFENQESHMHRMPVYRCTWKSFRKMGIFKYINPETGQQESEVVDEYFEYDKKDPDQSVEWFWVSQYWSGIRIGNDMYLEDTIKPNPHQFRSIDNISECKSGYIGNISSARNSPSTSMMDRVIPWIYLYLVTWYNTELALATNIGKIGLIDLSIVPEGWDIEKWLYYARAMRIGFVNSLNEGNRKLGLSGQNMSTQNKELNLEMGSYIQFNISLLQQIEQKIMFTTGVSPQRLGDIGSYEAVGNTQNAIVNSSMITENEFRIHNGIKLRVCDAIIDVAKTLIGENKKVFQYITDDLAEILFEVDGPELMGCDLGVFSTNADKDMEAYQMYKEHVKFALQNDQMAFHQIGDLYTSESIAEIRNKLKDHFMMINQQQQEQQQQMIAVEQEKIAAQQEAHQDELDMRQYISDTTNQAKIAVAQINSYIGQENMDQDGNGIVDPIELGNQALKRLELDSNNMIEKLKAEQEKVKQAKEERLKREELNIRKEELSIKKNAEKEKLKVERENMKNDLQIARINAKNRAKSKTK